MELRLDAFYDGLEFATVLEWRRREGQTVEVGDPVLEIEADKANHEIKAPVAGTLTSQVAAEGDEIRVGDLLGVIEAA